MLALDGSTATRRTPRGEQGVRLLATFVTLEQPATVAAPLCTSVQVAPASTDR